MVNWRTLGYAILRSIIMLRTIYNKLKYENTKFNNLGLLYLLDVESGRRPVLFYRVLVVVLTMRVLSSSRRRRVCS